MQLFNLKGKLANDRPRVSALSRHTPSLSCWRGDSKHLLFPACLNASKGKLIFSSAGNQFQDLAKCSTIELDPQPRKFLCVLFEEVCVCVCVLTGKCGI